ncbi:hypothetical protein NHX12_024918 [Muraenolepis orangiensis]|uniref:Polycystin cation channel PKD1/PKD2 domain-containing protein n=1 Tax=Muraenolepis orangiensis TaxID=630683 RepID=A0A9Q0EH89_9TELE|nr:hypothetical protein NHX12_024918 [Muraenolepis orangiensis]
MDSVLVPHLHLRPWPLRLVGLPRLRVTPYISGDLAAPEVVPLGNSSAATGRLLAELAAVGGATRRFRTLSVDFTQYHRETGLLVLLFTAALLFLAGEVRAMASERAQYARQGWRWLQLCLASLSLGTAMLQLQFLSQASSCVQQLRSSADIFVDFRSAALLGVRWSQLAAVLLTLLLLKLLGTLRFVRRWVLGGRVLALAWRELGAAFSVSTQGFGSPWQAGVSAVSLLRGRVVLRRLRGAHPVLGPLFTLLLTGGGLWVLARLCGAVMIRHYRTAKAEMYQPAVGPQDYEMVELFIKRLKLWMGLTKAKEFRHRVKFEGMGSPPSRGSCRDSLLAPSPSVSPSPRPPSASPSVRSEDSCASADPAPDFQERLDRLLPGVDAVLSGFERVIRVMEEVHCLEASVAHPRRPRISLPTSASFDASALLPLPSARPNHFGVRLRNSRSESYSAELSPGAAPPGATPPGATPPGDHLRGPPGTAEPSVPRRRAWHSGSSHWADAALGVLLAPESRVGDALLATGRPRSEEGVWGIVGDGAPIKRKAWISSDVAENE